MGGVEVWMKEWDQLGHSWDMRARREMPRLGYGELQVILWRLTFFNIFRHRESLAINCRMEGRASHQFQSAATPPESSSPHVSQRRNRCAWKTQRSKG